MKRFLLIGVIIAVLCVYNYSWTMHSQQKEVQRKTPILFIDEIHTIGTEGDAVSVPADWRYGMSQQEEDLQKQLKSAIRKGDERRVQELIERGVPLDRPDNSGWTPLHSAAIEGHEGIVRILLSSGIKELVRNSRGYTPADVAKTPAIKQLIERRHLPVRLYRDNHIQNISDRGDGSEFIMTSGDEVIRDNPRIWREGFLDRTPELSDDELNEFRKAIEQ